MLSERLPLPNTWNVNAREELTEKIDSFRFKKKYEETAASVSRRRLASCYVGCQISEDEDASRKVTSTSSDVIPRSRNRPKEFGRTGGGERAIWRAWGDIWRVWEDIWGVWEGPNPVRVGVLNGSPRPASFRLVVNPTCRQINRKFPRFIISFELHNKFPIFQS